MPKIVVEKNSNYTIISNAVFKDKRLSVKEKGLLATMLSLPDGWDYTISGLSKLSNDGVTTIRNSLKKLEEFGYLERRQVKENGKFVDVEYVVYEEPITKKPLSENLISENLISENLISENLTQLNTKELNTKELNTKELNTYDSIPQNPCEENAKKTKRINYIHFVELYHSICHSLPKCKKLSEDRKKKIKNILSEYTEEEIMVALKKAENSDFLKSGGNGTWTGADFDWIFNKKNMIKIIEGRYDNKNPRKYHPDDVEGQRDFYDDGSLLRGEVPDWLRLELGGSGNTS